MIIDRHPPVRLFGLVPGLPEAFEPELAQLDRLLADDAIFRRVKADMARRRPHGPTLGRPGAPVGVISAPARGRAAPRLELQGGRASRARQPRDAPVLPSTWRRCRRTPPTCAGPVPSRPRHWSRPTK